MKLQDQVTSREIVYNGVRVTCHSDGSITKYNKASNRPIHTSGDSHGNQYCTVWLNGENELVHKIIAEAFIGKHKYGFQVDHIDGNKKNNKPENLRYVTPSENQKGYKSKRANTSSIYRGVSWDITRNKWKGVCETRVNGKRHRRGTAYFQSEKDAAIARDKIACELGFPLEGLNFPELFLDKMHPNVHVNTMKNTEENIERLQTQIEMIRSESRLLSYRIERMMEQRKTLSEEKRLLKQQLEMASI